MLFLLVIIAFSSGTEVAMLSVNRYRIKHRAQQGQKTAKVLEALLQKPDDWLGANLVILAAALWFIFANTQDVKVRLWVPTVSAPMWLVIELNSSGCSRPIEKAPKPPIDTPLMPRWSRSGIVR